jgi:hypothetical protein
VGVDYDGFGLGVAFISSGGSTKGLSPDGSFILFGDQYTIKKVDVYTRQVSTVVGVSGAYGQILGSGNQVRMMMVTNLVVSNDGTFALVMDSPRILYLNISTMTVSEWVGGLVNDEVDGIGTAARIGETRQSKVNLDITPDNSRVYFADSGNIRMIEVKTRNVTTIAGCGFSGDMVDGIGRSACFGIDVIVLVDPSQSFLLIAETWFYVLRTMDLNTLEVKTVLGQNGVNGIVDGVGAEANLGEMTAMAFSPDGTRVFLASLGGIRVIYVNEWRITHLTANDNLLGYMDGDKTTVMFNYIDGLNMQCATGQTQCANCPVGKYNSDVASISCKIQECAYLCPNGFYNSDCASTSPDTCQVCTNSV